MTSPCPTARSRFGIRFSLIARRWRRELVSALASEGLTDATWAPLVHLDETGGGITQKQLAALVGVDASSLVRLLDILERKGLIERKADAADGRSRRVYLTADGDVQVRKIREHLVRNEEAMLVDISDDDIALMVDMLERIDVRLGECQSVLADSDAGAAQ